MNLVICYFFNSYIDFQEMNQENLQGNENGNHRKTGLPEEYADAFCFDGGVINYDNVISIQVLYF